MQEHYILANILSHVGILHFGIEQLVKVAVLKKVSFYCYLFTFVPDPRKEMT